MSQASFIISEGQQVLLTVRIITLQDGNFWVLRAKPLLKAPFV
jgi:hypothetical protein